MHALYAAEFYFLLQQPERALDYRLSVRVIGRRQGHFYAEGARQRFDLLGAQLDVVGNELCWQAFDRPFLRGDFNVELSAEPHLVHDGVIDSVGGHVEAGILDLHGKTGNHPGVDVSHKIQNGATDGFVRSVSETSVILSAVESIS